MTDFDPSGVGRKGSLFGFPYSVDEAELVILPVPWDVTVSYSDGTSRGPAAILEASSQLDFSVFGLKEPWRFKTAMLDPDPEISSSSLVTRSYAERVIEKLEAGENSDPQDLLYVNDASKQMLLWCRSQIQNLLDHGKIVATLGGDHSTPLGLVQALGEQHSFGILQIDAHMDLRKAYEGFEYSHASIMYNCLNVDGVTGLTQVGIRDYCEEEEQYIAQSEKPVNVFYSDQISSWLFQGTDWQNIVQQIISTLPQNVYISFDIDGLNPELCPNTGTPVPGGLQFEQATYLLHQLGLSGKKIVGFDLSEVSPGQGDWDANVGARILYRLCCALGVSQGFIKGTEESS